MACSVSKTDNIMAINNSYDSLLRSVLKTSFEDNEDKCVYNRSVSFEFRFPDSFDGGYSHLSKGERELIEQQFKSPSFDWNIILRGRFRSSDSPNCLHISKPIFFRGNKFAFVFTAQLGAEYYSIYENVNSYWQFKENIIIVLN
jgi:hypothetical protein